MSVTSSDRSEVTQHKINFIKNCSQLGLNQWPPNNTRHLYHFHFVFSWLYGWDILWIMIFTRHHGLTCFTWFLGTNKKFYFCIRCCHTFCPLTRINIKGHHALYVTSQNWNYAKMVLGLVHMRWQQQSRFTMTKWILFALGDSNFFALMTFSICSAPESIVEKHVPMLLHMMLHFLHFLSEIYY